MAEELALLRVAEMYRADRAAMAAGVTGVRLMENAGYAVARAVAKRVPSGRIAVLCGPGNNGGDGFVAARHLRTWGYTVRLALMGRIDALKGDAMRHATVWGGPVEALSPDVLTGVSGVVDALFGAGLSRSLQGETAAVVETLNAMACPVVAVDVPSGVSGDTGEVVGDLAVHAGATVSFFRAKPGHWLYPGRAFCGRLTIADIGIPDCVLRDIVPRLWRNEPALWCGGWPWRHPESHKYRYGHALILGGGEATGAGRLAASAALRIGAGLVTAAVPSDVRALYAGATPSLMTAPLESGAPLDAVLADPRRNAVLLGPGAGVTENTRSRAGELLHDGRAIVLDADALTVFGDAPIRLAEACHANVVLTPHDGEFARLCPDLDGDRLIRAQAAAMRFRCVVVLKGADTVVAGPDGQAAIAGNAPPCLATAGSGDVLAGAIAGALAQGLAPFDAACAAVWCLGAAAQRLGPGMISADLPTCFPAVLAALEPAGAGCYAKV